MVMFTNDNDDMTFRKAFGSDDISGDYNEYSEKLTENVDGTDIEIRGNDGKYCGHGSRCGIKKSGVLRSVRFFLCKNTDN